MDGDIAIDEIHGNSTPVGNTEVTDERRETTADDAEEKDADVTENSDEYTDITNTTNDVEDEITKINDDVDEEEDICDRENTEDYTELSNGDDDEINKTSVGDEEDICDIQNIEEYAELNNNDAEDNITRNNNHVTFEIEALHYDVHKENLSDVDILSVTFSDTILDEEILNIEHISQPSIFNAESDDIEIQKINQNSEEEKKEKDLVYNIVDVLEKSQVNPQEPWPKDVKLFQPYEVEQILLPDNANCLAVQAFLKMCGLDFIVEPRANAEAMSPSGKVPFIKAGAFVISELEPIVQFVNNKGITLTDKLDPDMKSDLRAYMSLVHNVLEVAELYICWCDKETYNEVTSIRHGSIYPWPLNHIQNRAKRAAVIKKLKVLEWYQKSMAEVFQDVENCCQALTDRLEGKDFFFGDKPTELDALVFGHLFTILTTPLPNSHIANTVRNYPVLINLVQRIERDYFKRETKH